MKLVRGFVFFIVAISFVVSVFLAGTFFVVSSSLSYEVLYPNLSSSVNEVLEYNYNMSNYLDNNYDFLVDYCSPKDFYRYNYSLIGVQIPCSDVVLGENESLKVIYENVSLASDLVLENIKLDVERIYPFMKESCSIHEVYSSNISRMNLSCEAVLLGKEETKESVIEDFVDDVYYKKYNCDYFNCITKTGSTFFLVSEMSRNYWKAKFNFFFWISLGLFVLAFFLIESKVDLLSFLGISFILSSLPLLKIEKFLFFIIKPFFSGMDYLNYIDSSTILSAFSIFFSQSRDVFNFLLYSGIILLVIWAGLKLWLVFTGRDKKTFSKKEVEKIVAEEVKKSVEKAKSSKAKKSKSF